MGCSRLREKGVGITYVLSRAGCLSAHAHAARAPPRAAVHCGCLPGAQQARAGAIDASRPQLSNHVWVGGAHRHPFPSNFQLNHSGADLRHKNSWCRIASNTPSQILDVDLVQTVHALARKTRCIENAHVCQLVFW